MIHNTETISDLNKDFSVDVGLVGDAKLTLQNLISEAKRQLGEGGKRGTTGVAQQIADIHKEWMNEWVALLS